MKHRLCLGVTVITVLWLLTEAVNANITWTLGLLSKAGVTSENTLRSIPLSYDTEDLARLSVGLVRRMQCLPTPTGCLKCNTGASTGPGGKAV